MRRALAFALCLIAALGNAFDATARTLVRDSEIERTLQMMMNPIFDAADMPRDEIKIFILADRSLNAFISRGRSMFLHTGLLQTLETPEELMGVMAHETGHVTGGHLVKRIAAFEQARTQSIISTIIGVAAAAAGAGVGGFALGSSGGTFAERNLLRFTRSQEASADQASVTFLTRAGIDPAGTLKVLQRLEREQAYLVGNRDPYTLTHPLSRERIALLEENVSRSPALGQKASPEIYYWHARMRAKLDGFISAPTDNGDRWKTLDEIELYREAINLHRLPSPDRAVAAMDRLIAMRPDDPFYWELKGQILRESGRGGDAVQPYTKALQLKPGDPLIASGLGEALLSQETPASNAKALEILSQAALDDPYDAGLRRPLAVAYARAGNDGMAAVATAERLALSGRMSDAAIQARRAQAVLPKGSPGWLRADDVLALKPPN
ncbi:MAG: M48 family metalloprotease [Pseudomonadota bacterium]